MAHRQNKREKQSGLTAAFKSKGGCQVRKDETERESKKNFTKEDLCGILKGINRENRALGGNSKAKDALCLLKLLYGFQFNSQLFSCSSLLEDRIRQCTIEFDNAL